MARVSIGAALRRSKSKCLRCGHGPGSHLRKSCGGAHGCACTRFVDRWDAAVGIIILKAASFPCNGDNGSRTRRPCTDTDELPCPYCQARRLLEGAEFQERTGIRPIVTRGGDKTRSGPRV